MSIMEAFGFPNQGVAKVHLLRAVREAGAVRLEADYSGGNDEGGVNDIRIWDAKGEALPVPDSWVERDPRPGDSKWSIRDGKVSEYHPLWQAADDMLATEFGSWAGEFSAYGTLLVDTVAGTVARSGEVQSGYDSDSRDY
jgi:hypothetical protein